MEVKENDYKIFLRGSMFLIFLTILTIIYVITIEVENPFLMLCPTFLTSIIFLLMAHIEKLEYKLQEEKNGGRKKEGIRTC